MAGRSRDRGVLWALTVALVPASAMAQGRPSRTEIASVIEQAETLSESGHASAALAALESLLERDPSAAEALEVFVRLAPTTGHGQRALELTERARARSSAPALVALWVRALIGAGLADSARAAALEWIAAEPDQPGARFALADSELARRDTATALVVLGAGEVDFPGEPGFASRRAAVALSQGDSDLVAEIWYATLAGSGDGAARVVGQVAGPGSVQALEALWRRVRRDGGAAIRGRAAIVALGVGDPVRARALADALEFESLGERLSFLRSYADAAVAASASNEVTWAATELAAASPRLADRMRWRALAADEALTAGDTGQARAVLETAVTESVPGEGGHGVATRRLFDLMVTDPDGLEDARTLWRRYPNTYPDSTRVFAEMSAALALGDVAADGVARASRTLSDARRRLGPEGPLGPVDAAAAHLSVIEGDRDSAVVQLSRASRDPGARPASLTATLDLLGAVETSNVEEVEALGRAFLALSGPGTFDPQAWLALASRLPVSPGRPALLQALAAELARRGRDVDAARLRVALVERHPASPQAPAALLALARATSDPEAARRWLERLVTGFPSSALAPLGRRLLAELDRGVASPATGGA